MIEEIAIVRAVDGDFILVEPQRGAHCGSCSAQSGCGTAALGKALGTRPIEIRVRNSLAVGLGDRVVIGMEAADLTRLSLFAYVVPILLMIGSAILFGSLAGRLVHSLGEPVAAIAGLGGLVAGLYWLRTRAMNLQCLGAMEPVLLRRADEPVVRFDVSPVQKRMAEASRS